ncbi:MAG: type II toxin-antitoxin system VapC family toxin [Solirubrobacterales bacterium]
MIVDTSALLAIVFGESDAVEFEAALDAAESIRISASTLLEASVVVDGKGDRMLSRAFDEIVGAIGAKVDSFTVEQAEIAREAYRDFGRGSGHPAQLNFGDCFSYALAYATGEPLLYKGDDFGETDIASVF